MVGFGEIAGYDSYGKVFRRKETKPEFYATTRWDRYQMLSRKYPGRTVQNMDGEPHIMCDLMVRVMDAIEHGDVEYFKAHPNFKWKSYHGHRGKFTQEYYVEGWSDDWHWIRKPRIRRRHTVAKAAKKLKLAKGSKDSSKTAASVKTVAKPAKEDKKTKSASKAGSARNTGKTTGMKIAAYQDDLMKNNFKARLTDEQLAKKMRDEFPLAIAYTVEHVRGIRSSWNSGTRASQDGVPPNKPLPEFDEAGSEVTRKRGLAKKEKTEKKADKKADKKAAKKGKAAPEEDLEEDDEDEVDSDDESSDDEEDDEEDDE